MSNNFFIRDGIGGSAGMIVHEATKNFEKGKRFWRDAEGVPAAGAWIRDVYRDAHRADAIDYGAFVDPSAEMASFIDTLFRRRSVRAYSQKALSLQALAGFLALTYPPEVIDADYAPDLQPHQSLVSWNGHVTACRLILIARDVEGLKSGPYLVDERARALRPIGLQPGHAEVDILGKSCFQEEFRLAPAFFLQIGSIHDAIERYGERGYRYMLIENGVQMQRMYLAAAALGMAGCVTGSIIQKDFEEWLGIDGYTAAALNGFALGLLPDDASRPPQAQPDSEV